MNGVIAAAFWTSALLHPNYSLLDGLDRQKVNSYRAASMSVVQFQKENIGYEISLAETKSFSYGPLQPVILASITDRGGFWAGYGFYNEIETTMPISVGFSFLPGIYEAGAEVDLGGWLMFRSAVHLNYDISELWRLSLIYDHRSSGDLWEFNPGMETVQLSLGKKL